MRSVGLDVHLDFCEVAIVEDGEVRSAGRVETKPERLELFAGSLCPDDRVALEVTGNAWEIARIFWRRGLWMGCGCRMRRRGLCAGVCRGAASWCGRAAVRRTRSMPC